MQVIKLTDIVATADRTYTAVYEWSRKHDFPTPVGIGGRTKLAKLYPLEEACTWLLNNGRMTPDQLAALRERAGEVLA